LHGAQYESGGIFQQELVLSILARGEGAASGTICRRTSRHPPAVIGKPVRRPGLRSYLSQASGNNRSPQWASDLIGYDAPPRQRMPVARRKKREKRKQVSA